MTTSPWIQDPGSDMLHNANGDRLKCRFIDNEANGPGILYRANGDRLECIWIADKANGPRDTILQ